MGNSDHGTTYTYSKLQENPNRQPVAMWVQDCEGPRGVVVFL